MAQEVSGLRGWGVARTVTLAVVGDSISVGDSPRFSAGRFGPGSWVRYAVGGDVRFAGGWAVSGATTAQMARAVVPVDADALVILAGTNDAAAGVPFAESAWNLRSIAATVGAPRIVVSSIPPIDPGPVLATAFNQYLHGLAAAEGWEFLDAMVGIRHRDCFADGMSYDGIHPTVMAAEVIGAAIRNHLVGTR